MDYSRLFQSDVSQESVKAWRAQGKKALGVVCCHIPEEILYAADVLPIRLRATGCTDASEAEMWMSAFSCSFAKSILQYWLNGTYDLDGLVATDGCMMAARIYDNADYINDREKTGKLVKQYAAPRKLAKPSLAFYKDEMRDMIADIEAFTGNKVTDEKLKAAVAKLNEARRLVAQVYELRKAKNPVISGVETLQIMLASTDLPVDEYIELLKAFLEDAPNRKPITDYRARLLLIGSALDNPEYIRVIEDKGGLVVADTLCFGKMAFGDEIVIDDSDVLGSITDHYLKRLVCPRMMDKHTQLHDYIIQTAREYSCDGVLYQMMQYCECWGGENTLLEKRLKDEGIPQLTLEREEIMANAGQLAVRAEAFIEMIEEG